MKKLIILLFVTVSYTNVKAQDLHSYADTANYLIHQIENKKNLYVGQPLSVLLDSLKIDPVRSIAGAGMRKEDFGKDLRLYFNWERDFERKHFIIIEFNSVPEYTTLFPVFYPAIGQGGTLQSILLVYRPLIVKDVFVKDYTNDEPVNPDVHY
ncbi:hypothetical protein I5M32_15915 [Pedobacter sp. SD-b]|uniref:DUF3887 domain-containing protein n=1 Tax=Pedobacter segetis TaxID=2793069 RepID=A0ABS1BNH5_9SPHI|nr:hypothetical protein [Pedobacter segetis]MBK0384452.1 hypothetical protein [Pedobacter segetis]